jgi:hypothetical protein
VTVKVSPDFSAHTIGGRFNGEVAWGEVVMGTKLMQLLSSDEIDFVLAHEIIHISENHLADRVPYAVVRGLYEFIAIEEPGMKLLLAGFDLWKVYQQAQGTTRMFCGLMSPCVMPSQRPATRSALPATRDVRQLRLRAIGCP